MKMKKNQWRFLALLMLAAVLCAGCSGGGNASGGDVKTVAEVPVIINQAEYLLYQNIFYNEYAAQYENKPVTKNGVFATIQDAYSNKTRYYVWGYLDNTQCCDWQWEFVPADTKSLPATGSLVTVTGTFVRNDAEALDDYWIKDAQVTTVTEYAGKTAEINMLAMSDTLERVQVLNIMNKQDAFEGKTFTAYGRIAGINTLQDPYYDGSWMIPFSSSSDAPAIGTSVVLTGKVASGMLGDCQITVKP